MRRVGVVVLAMAFTAVANLAPADAGRPLGNVGELTGHVMVKKQARVGWKVVAKRSGVLVATDLTYNDGIFTFRLTPGVYRISAVGGHGQKCGNAKVAIERHQEAVTSLIC